MPLLGAALLNDRLVGVDEVPRGVACGCVCPACREPVIAKQGECRIHHFAHDGGRACRYAAETLAHLLAKQVLEKEPALFLPSVYATPGGDRLTSDQQVHFDRVELEGRIGEIVPDVIAYRGSTKLLIEIVVTHPPGQLKIQRIAEMNISALQIKLGNPPLVNLEVVRKAVLSNRMSNRAWLFNRKAAKKRRTLPLYAAIKDDASVVYVYKPNYYAWFPKAEFHPLRSWNK